MAYPLASQHAGSVLILFAGLLAAGQAWGQVPATSPEAHMKNQWFARHVTCDKPDLPFSFVYDGKPAGQLLTDWPNQSDRKALSGPGGRTQHTRTWTDPKTALQVRCVAVDYSDFPAAEWTVWFTNTSKTDSAVLEKIQGLDVSFDRGQTGEFVLHGIAGDSCRPESYQPFDRPLKPKESARFAPVGGRSTNGAFPYYNLQWPDGGVLLAVGWPGQWATSFARDGGTSLRVQAGQERTRLVLAPGQTVRSPLIAAMFWKGQNLIDATNLWRRWYMAHNLPRIGGQPLAPMAQMQLCLGFNDGAAVMQREAERFAKAGIEIDLYWRDAGWYPCQRDWQKTGTWQVDRTRFPDGFKPISEWVHARGKKLIVWFEPERVGDSNSELAREHGDWLLGKRLLNLGNAAARDWVVERVDSLMRDGGIDHYRQDFNIDPLPLWQGEDSPDRQGLTENLYVQGYLAFWDELRRRRPDMLIDSCASGGRRNDLETMRRSVPLLRSDYQPANTWQAQQGQTYGLSFWLPYYGSGVYSVDTYGVRSFFMPGFGLGGNQDLAKAKVLFDECRLVAPRMLGDYYPLTGYSLALDQWMAWQFDRPDHRDGVVQAFRREKNAQPAQTFKLSSLATEARYELRNLDEPGTTTALGKDLMTTGLTVQIPNAPGAAIILYQQAPAK